MKSFKVMLSVALLSVMVRLLKCTYRIRVFNMDHREVAVARHSAGSFCFALWHEYLLAGILTHAGQKIAPLASLSSDGEIVTRVMNSLGYKTVRGSSHRGGVEARDDLVEASEDGWFTAVTVDGPRGPRRRVKGGVIDVARRTGVSIVPLVAAADREWILTKSWDQFRIPKPFARIAVQYGTPLAISGDTQGLAFGHAKQQVRAGLEACEQQARSELAAWIKN